MNVADSLLRLLHSNLIYKFTFVGCNSLYFGGTSQHLSTGVLEHLHSDTSAHIYNFLKGSDKCRKSCTEDSFTSLDTASGYSHLKN